MTDILIDLILIVANLFSTLFSSFSPRAQMTMFLSVLLRFCCCLVLLKNAFQEMLSIYFIFS